MAFSKGMFKAHIPSNLEWKGGARQCLSAWPAWEISPDIWFSLLKRTEKIGRNFDAITI